MKQSINQSTNQVTNQVTNRTEHVVMQVLDTAAALERGMDSALSFSRGVTFSEYRMLRALQDAERGLTRVALASMLSVSPSGVTRALKPLEKLGYVTTVKNARDARQSLATLTSGGHELLSDVSGVLNDYLNGLDIDSVSESHLSVLEEVLRKLRDR